MFYGFVITEAGNALLAGMVAGQTLTITGVTMDKGTAESAETARQLTAPIEPGPDGTSTVPTVDGNAVNMIVEYRSDLNGGLQEGFWIGGFSIFGKVSDGEETMIGYGSLGDAKQYVSTYVSGTAPDVRRYPISITVTTGIQVDVNYPAEAWMTAEDVADYFNGTLSPFHVPGSCGLAAHLHHNRTEARILIMTSEERREARYHRRKAAREARRRRRCEALGGIEQAFSFRKMFKWGKKCCNNVRWKQSTQNFERHLFSGTARRRRDVLSGKWRPKPGAHFILRERGKIRPIDAPHINDRQIHKTMTKEVLEPLYTPSMIYRNGASQQGKGLHFHHKELKKILREHYRKHGREGYMVLMDLKQFFPSAPHAAIYERHRRLILDPEIRAVADMVVASVPGGVGMPLGVEPSQMEMVSLPSAVDNWTACQLRAEDPAHYMDDYHMGAETKEQAEAIRDAVTERMEAMGLTVSRSKTRIVPLSKPFRFCKVKFYLTTTGKVITHGNRDGMKRARRKLKAFKAKVDAGEMTVQQVREWLTSQIAYFENYNDHGRVLRLNRLFYAIYGGAEQCSRSSKTGQAWA